MSHRWNRSWDIVTQISWARRHRHTPWAQPWMGTDQGYVDEQEWSQTEQWLLSYWAFNDDLSLSLKGCLVTRISQAVHHFQTNRAQTLVTRIPAKISTKSELGRVSGCGDMMHSLWSLLDWVRVWNVRWHWETLVTDACVITWLRRIGTIDRYALQAWESFTCEKTLKKTQKSGWIVLYFSRCGKLWQNC